MKRFIWNTYLDSLEKKYSLFYINRKYKDTSFKSEEEYRTIQTKVTDEIDILSKEIKSSIEDVVHSTYPEVEVLLYDSIRFSRANMLIGAVLTKGIKSQSEILDVKECFEKISGVKILIDRFEDQSEEVQKKIEKILSKK